MMTLLQYQNWKNLTQAQLAEQLGITQGEVSKLCSEKVGRRPSWEMAAHIEKATDGAVPMSVWARVKGNTKSRSRRAVTA